MKGAYPTPRIEGERGRKTDGTNRLGEDEILRRAGQDVDLPDTASAADRALHATVRLLYWQHKAGYLSVEEGKRLKQRAIVRYRDNVKTQEWATRQQLYIAELWKRVENAANEYRKNRTVENADKLMEALYGMQ